MTARPIDSTRALAIALVCLATPVFGAYVAATAVHPSAEPTVRSKAPVGIIVLGGGLANLMAAKQKRTAPTGPGMRIVAGIELAKHFPEATLLYTGKEDDPGPLSVLTAAGIPEGQILLETRSRTTAENARFSADLVRPRPEQRWILVTSADHMRRAEACFREAGFTVEPYPVHPGSLVKGEEPSIRERLGSVAYAVLGLCRS